MMTIDIPEGYESLGLALGEAAAQASRGKGAERHAESGEKFSDQLIMSIPKRLGDGGECFCLGQALKKICESRRLPPERARAELLGAVNYLAAAWCLLGGGESVSAPESFASGDAVEWLGPDGWTAALFDREMNGQCFLSSGGRQIVVSRGRVRRAETEDISVSSAPLFTEGTPVEFCHRGVWTPGVYVGVDPEGSHVVECRGVRRHLDRILVRKA